MLLRKVYKVQPASGGQALRYKYVPKLELGNEGWVGQLR